MKSDELSRKLGLDSDSLDLVLSYIEKFWPRLVRENREDSGSLIGLPNPYIVPAASDWFQEMYYWDSYPVILALLSHKKYGKIARGMVDNLLYLVERFGIIPNATRFYFLSRSQPPLLSSMVWAVYEKEHDLHWFKNAMRLVEFEYKNVWYSDIHPNYRRVYRNLSRFYDINVLHDLAEAESGWDMTARYSGKCMEYLPIDLNCLLYVYEQDIARASKVLGNPNKQRKFEVRARERAKAINELMWNENTGYWFDFNFVREQQSPLVTVAGGYALTSKIATQKQAEMTASFIERNLQKKYGIVQSVRFVENKQWDWPNGWALMQLRVVEGLMNYGLDHLALRIIKKWLAINIRLFEESGKLWEKYDVVHGRIGMADRYPTQHGFAWTNACFLILLDFAKDLVQRVDLPSA